MDLESTQKPLDIMVIGGGINGVGIANDAAGRGLQVALCEQHDLACATSSASSKLIHGGLRYLEHQEFRLVREALREREILLRKAPHIVWPLRFILPHLPHLRPSWVLRLGLFIYDHLSPRTQLPPARSLSFKNTTPLRSEIKKGFEYSDCWVDDARLVVVNALQAHQQGAEILLHTRCTQAEEVDGLWRLTLEDAQGRRLQRQARVLINATGPWVESFVRHSTSHQPRYGIRMIKGSHIVTRRINQDDRAYILQNQDKRIVFVLPWLDDFSLIGTTDVVYKGDPEAVKISDLEIDYLLDVVNHHFTIPLTREDIVSHFAGVRPLCDDESSNPSAMTRDYTLDLDTQGPPLLSVFGGKITTYRKLAEAALAQLAEYFPEMGANWTAEAGLPGGNIPNREAYVRQLELQYPFLTPQQTRRFAASYGSLCETFLQSCQDAQDMGEDFGGGLTQVEVDYLIEHEWAQTAEDILWRRTKLKLRLDRHQQQRLTHYLAEHPTLQAKG